MRILITTPCGDMIFAVDENAAPLTAAHFVEFVRRGLLQERSRIYRIVREDNCERPPPIDVVQFGWVSDREGESPPLPPVPHEPTNVTGLCHVDGSLSLARYEPGSGTSAFFICVGDQPALDYGGKRAADGAGFAAFGRLVTGREVLTALHMRAGKSEWLEEPISIGGRILGSKPIAG